MIRLARRCAWLLVTSALAHAEPSLPSAERAAAQLHWAEARGEVEALMRQGGLDRTTLLLALELRAEIAAVIDGPAAGEREYKKLLLLDPGHAGPRRASPVFSQPFQRAQKWAGDAGPLRLEHTPPEGVPANQSSALVVTVIDPLALVAGVRAVGHAGKLLFQIGPPPRLPAVASGVPVEYALEALDGFGNVLAIAGAAQPFRTRAVATAATATGTSGVSPALLAAEPSPRRRWWPAAAGVAGGALVIAGVAIGLNVAARDEYAALQTSCAPGCSADQLARLHGEKDASIALYGAAAAAAATALVLLIVDRVHR